MEAGRRVDELTRDANPTCRLSDAALEHVTHAQLTADLFDVDRLAFISETGIARDHKQPGNARKSGDDIFHHAVGEIVLLRVATQVIKRQNSDRWFIGQS